MARFAFWKLLHPFTPDDILESRQIVSSLKLPAGTSQFVLALTDPESRGNVVYVLAVERLSERSIGDIHTLVSAVNPRLVVAFVHEQGVRDVLEEGNLLDAPEFLDVPTSAVDVIKACFARKTKATAYESRAGLRVLMSVFGTTFYGNVFAAKEAAGIAQAKFECLRYPSTSASSFSDDQEGKKSMVETATTTKLSFTDRFLTVFSGLLGGNDSDSLAGSSPRASFVTRSSSLCGEYKALATIMAPNITYSLATSSISSTDSQVPSTTFDDISVDDSFPSFAAPFYPLFLDLHSLYKDTQGVNRALLYLKRLLNSVERGDDVDVNDLSRARLFRVAVESVRLCWNSIILRERKASGEQAKFSELSVDEKCQALLGRAIQLQARKFKKVVAIVDANFVSGIRRHWNTPIPPEVAAYADDCVLALNWDDTDSSTMIHENALEKLEAKAAVVVSAGAVAAGLFTLPQWTSAPAFMKILTFKVPTALKLVWLQMKRQAVVSWASGANTASSMMMPGLKAVGLGKAAAGPSSAAKAVLVKSVTSAENARAAAQTLVAAAERSSFRALRTAFYSLMRSRQTKTLGPRPWLMLGGTILATAGIFHYGDEVEGAIGIAPSIPSVVRLGQGLKNLDRASNIIGEREGSLWWDLVYDTLYRHPRQR